jgi:hypothetical protein
MMLMLDTYYDHNCHQLLPKANKPQSLNKDERDTFEGYLRYHQQNPTTASPEALASFRKAFEEWQTKKAATPKPGRMKLRDLKPGEYRYAVAVREGSELFMTLFIRRDPKGDVYVMIPRGRGSGNPRTSYHHRGRFHHKSYNRPNDGLRPATIDRWWFSKAANISACSADTRRRSWASPAMLRN